MGNDGNVSCWYGSADRNYNVYGMDWISARTFDWLATRDEFESRSHWYNHWDAENVDHWRALCNGRHCSINADDICHKAIDKSDASREFAFDRDAYEQPIVTYVKNGDEEDKEKSKSRARFQTVNPIHLPHGVLHFYSNDDQPFSNLLVLMEKVWGEEQKVIIDTYKENNLSHCGPEYLYLLGADEKHQEAAYHASREKPLTKLELAKRRLEIVGETIRSWPSWLTSGKFNGEDFYQGEILPRIMAIEKAIAIYWSNPEAQDVSHFRAAVLSALKTYHKSPTTWMTPNAVTNEKRGLIRTVMPTEAFVSYVECDEEGMCVKNVTQYAVSEEAALYAVGAMGRGSRQTDYANVKISWWHIQSLEFYLGLANVTDWGEGNGEIDDKCFNSEYTLLAYDMAERHFLTFGELAKRVDPQGLTLRQRILFEEGLDWMAKLFAQYQELIKCVERHAEECGENQVLVASGDCVDCEEGTRANDKKTACLGPEVTEDKFKKGREDCEKKYRRRFDPKTGNCGPCLPKHKEIDGKCHPTGEKEVVKVEPKPEPKPELTREDCAEKEMILKDGECKPCPPKTRFDKKSMSCKRKRVARKPRPKSKPRPLPPKPKPPKPEPKKERTFKRPKFD